MKWIDDFDQIVSNYNYCIYSTTGVKPFVLFRSTERSARRFFKEMGERSDINSIRQKVIDYIEKWKTEYIHRVEQTTYRTENRVIIAVKYRHMHKGIIVGALDSLYENDVCKIVDDEDNYYIISNKKSQKKGVRKRFVKKLLN